MTRRRRCRGSHKLDIVTERDALKKVVVQQRHRIAILEAELKQSRKVASVIMYEFAVSASNIEAALRRLADVKS